MLNSERRQVRIRHEVPGRRHARTIPPSTSWCRDPGTGIEAADGDSQSSTRCHASAAVAGGEYTRGLVTSRRKASRLGQGRPTDPGGPTVHHRASPVRPHGARSPRRWSRRGYWRRPGTSAVILALGDGEHLCDVIDAARKTPAQRQRACPAHLRHGVGAFFEPGEASADGFVERLLEVSPCWVRCLSSRMARSSSRVTVVLIASNHNVHDA